MSLNDTTSAQDELPKPPKVFNLGGVKIGFPLDLKPYPSQLSMMAKAVTGARKGQNCLLESPTGSGKTMAMLCSLLAWQKMKQDEFDEAVRADAVAQHQANQMRFLDESQEQLVISADVLNAAAKTPQQTSRMQFLDDSPDRLPLSPMIGSLNATSPEIYGNSPHVNTSGFHSPDIFAAEGEDDDMDDFKPPKKKRATSSAVDEDRTRISVGSSPSPTVTHPRFKVEVSKSPTTQSPTAANTFKPPTIKTRVPKIYFATRTHKQIAQVVKEFERTPYRNVNMTILNSREHSCIRQLELPYNNKTEMCRALLEGEAKAKDDENKRMKTGCIFKKNLDRLHGPMQVMNHLDMDTPWDIEDLVHAGKARKCCPYYASRELMSSAQIIFCPYNYIIDPLIRASMKISLKDNVVVFDEAHNIEDSIREATSYTLDENPLQLAITDCKKAIFSGAQCDAHQKIKKVLETLHQWMQECSEHLKLEDSFSNERSCTWTGTQYLAHMEDKGIGASNFASFKDAVEKISEEEISGTSSQEGEEGVNQELEEAEKATVKMHQLYKPTENLRRVTQGLVLVWGYLYKNDTRHRDDYNIVLYENVSRIFAEDRSSQSEEGWMARPKVSTKNQLGLHFWCANPALGFADFHDTHSVIVTSGTLSPMGSFQSELGVMFPNTLSTDHVIHPSQAWVATVGVGPTSRLINGTYRNAITLEYQDEVGASILKICQAVPYGVLCFFPSYVMLENVIKRWQVTGKWEDLVQCKEVIKEPRKAAEFSRAMTNFDQAVRRAEMVTARGASFSKGEQTGALFLAVFRGKLSEGIDFKDNHARAVITVSIPFPNMRSLEVKLKKKYNDKNHLVTRHMLPGNEWYEIQAYRAINQALGRCIRHRNDWGAIVMLDNRFMPGSKAATSLSKWATKQIRHFNSWDIMYAQLQQFMHTRLQLQKPILSTEVIDLA